MARINKRRVCCAAMSLTVQPRRRLPSPRPPGTPIRSSNLHDKLRGNPGSEPKAFKWWSKAQDRSARMGSRRSAGIKSEEWERETGHAENIKSPIGREVQQAFGDFVGAAEGAPRHGDCFSEAAPLSKSPLSPPSTKKLTSRLIAACFLLSRLLRKADWSGFLDWIFCRS
jgi:hypothetical protein